MNLLPQYIPISCGHFNKELHAPVLEITDQVESLVYLSNSFAKEDKVKSVSANFCFGRIISMDFSWCGSYWVKQNRCMNDSSETTLDISN